MSTHVILESISIIMAKEFIFCFKYLKINNVSLILNVWQDTNKNV
jgi:hypothetical protein